MWIPSYFKALSEIIRAGFSETKEALKDQKASIDAATESYANERRDKPRIVVAAPTEEDREETRTERKKDRTIQRVIATGTSATAVFTLGAAIGAFIYAHIAAKQASIMNNTLTEIKNQTPLIKKSADAATEAADAARTQSRQVQLNERAWVGVPNLGSPQRVIEPDHPVTVSAQIVNYGKIPAVLYDAGIAFEVRTSPVPRDYHYAHSETNEGIIYPQTIIYNSRSVEATVSASEFPDVRARKKWLVVHGYVRYRDQFGPHLTMYCFHWNGPAPTLTGLSFAPCAEHNCMDDGCKNQ